MGIEYEISYPKETMWQLIVRHGTPPTRRMRYCCEDLKENSGIGEKLVTGVRKAESKNREREREHAMPAVIIAENVRGLRPYLPVLRLEYERHGYTAHIEMFNSKYWNVPQNRDRYAVVGTRNKKNLSFTFPKEQHEFVPKLSDYLEKDVPEKYYLPDEKAQTIIAQAMEKLEKMGKCHACITPDRINKRQNGPRAKAEDEPMFTLTAQDLHGVIILEDEKEEESTGGAADNHR